MVDDFRRQVRGVVGDALRSAGYHQHKGQWRLKREDTDMETQVVKAPPVPNILGDVVVSQLFSTAGVNEKNASLITRQLDLMKEELGYATATQLERMLIDQIGICWLRHHLIENLYSQNVTGKGYTIPKTEHFERRLSASQNRYLRALEALARVRRLLRRPGVQINVAEKMVVTG